MIATFVGNYPQIANRPHPAKLRKATVDHESGKITQDEFERIQSEATTEVIDEQVQAGVDLITDGKIRWEDEQTQVMRKLRGLPIGRLIRCFDSNTDYRQPVCENAVEWTEPIILGDYVFAVKKSSQPIKAVLTGPYTLARVSENKYYQTLEEFMLALANALNQEARTLQCAGDTRNRKRAGIQFEKGGQNA